MKVGKLFLTIILLLITSIGYAADEITIQSQDISGGVNEFDRESLIKDNQSTVLKNAIIRKNGIATKRSGITEISSNTTTSTVNAVSHYYKLGDADKRLCVQYDNDLDVYDGTSWTADVFTDLTVSGECEMFTAGDYLWFVSPNMATRIYNFTDLTESGGTINDPPDSKAGIYHKGRVFLWGNNSNRDYLWYSAVGPDISDLFTFDRVSNALKIDSGDNQELIAVLEYGLTGNESLLALKEGSTYQIDTSDSTPGNWSIVKLFDYGCIARRTAVRVGQDVFFLSRDGGKYKIRTVSRTQYDTINIGVVPLSNEVEDILSDVSDAYIKNACAFFYDGYYILSFPSGSSTYNNKIVVYDTQRSAWIEWTGWTPSQFASFVRDNVEELYFGSDKAETKIYRALNGTDDDGTAINYQEESKQWTLGQPSTTKNWKNIEFEFTGQSSDYYVDIYIKLDEGGWTQIKNYNGNRLNLYVDTPKLPQTLPFNLVEPGVIRQTYDLSQLGRSRGLKWKISHNETGLGEDFQRLGVFLRGWVNKPVWEGEK